MVYISTRVCQTVEFLDCMFLPRKLMTLTYQSILDFMVHYVRMNFVDFPTLPGNIKVPLEEAFRRKKHECLYYCISNA